MPQCQQCNSALPAGARFCGRCGAPAPASPDASTVQAGTVQAGQADSPATAPVSYPPAPPAATAQGWASDPAQAAGGTEPGTGSQPPAAHQAQQWGAGPAQDWSAGTAQQPGAETPQWGASPAQPRDTEPAQQWGGPAQPSAEPAQQWGGNQWAQPQAYQPPAPGYPPSAYQQAAPAYPAPGTPFQPAEQRRRVPGPAIAGGVMAIAGALGIVGACALPVATATPGFGSGGSISLFKELGTAAAWWYLVEPIGVAALAIVAAVVIMAARGQVVPFAAAGILLGFGIQTAFLFLGYWRGFASGQQAGPAGVVGMLAGVLLIGAGLVAGAAVRRT
jgi:hypothetical protein